MNISFATGAVLDVIHVFFLGSGVLGL